MDLFKINTLDLHIKKKTGAVPSRFVHVGIKFFGGKEKQGIAKSSDRLAIGLGLRMAEAETNTKKGKNPMHDAFFSPEIEQCVSDWT